MSRRASKVDKNQREVIDVLRSLGCSVQSLAAIGGGCPDLLVGISGQNVLIEIKNGMLPPSKRGLNPFQRTWHENWHGKVHKVETVSQALDVVAFYRGRMRRATITHNEPSA